MRNQRRTVSGRTSWPVHLRQERPITGVEPHPLGAQLPLQHRELVAQRHDLHIPVAIAHRQHGRLPASVVTGA
jgi:hypothetical protein